MEILTDLRTGFKTVDRKQFAKHLNVSLLYINKICEGVVKNNNIHVKPLETVIVIQTQDKYQLPVFVGTREEACKYLGITLKALRHMLWWYNNHPCKYPLLEEITLYDEEEEELFS